MSQESEEERLDKLTDDLRLFQLEINEYKIAAEKKKAYNKELQQTLKTIKLFKPCLLTGY